MNTATSLEKELRKELIQLWNDDEFIDGVLAFARTEEERKSVLGLIYSNKDITSDDVLLFATYIAMDRDET